MTFKAWYKMTYKREWTHDDKITDVLAGEYEEWCRENANKR